MSGFVTISVTGKSQLSGGTASSTGSDAYQGGSASTAFTNTLRGGSATADALTYDGGTASTSYGSQSSGGAASTAFTDALQGGSAVAQVSFDDATIACRTLVPEIAAALSAQGIDPSKINSVEWPVYGASRWATATLLMDKAAVDGAGGLKGSLWDGGAGGPKIYCSLNFGEHTLPQMVLGKAIPVVVSAATSLYVVELHCRRWLWRHYKPIPPYAFEALAIARGYNLAGISRGRRRTRTLTGGDQWIATNIVSRVVAGDATNGYPALSNSTDTVLSPLSGLHITGGDLLVDISGDDSAPGLIDKVLAKSGGVFMFVPNSFANGYEMRIEAIDTGEARAATYFDENVDEIIAGGAEGFILASLTNTGVAANAVGNVEGVICDCPKKVRVWFPFATTDQSDEVMAETDPYGTAGATATGTGSVLDGKQGTNPAWDSDEGNPFGASYNNYRPALYHVNCDVPIVTFSRDTTSTSDLLYAAATIAGYVSDIFYGRYLAGCCDVWFRGFRAFDSDSVWSGAQWWTWQLRQDGGGFDFPVTHVYGTRDSDLFGYQAMNGPEKVSGFGTVQAWKSGDNSVHVVGNQLGPIPVMLRIKSASATDTYLWVYSAKILQRDDSLTVGNVTGWVEGQSVTAYNTVERLNSADFAGPSVALPLTSAPNMQPLAISYDRNGDHTDIDVIGFLVEDRQYAAQRYAYFSLDNTVDGSCE